MNAIGYATIVAVAAVAGGLPVSSLGAEAPAPGGDFISIKASELKWVDAPSLGQGAKISILEGDLKAAEPFTLRAKLPSKRTIGVHTHPMTERVTVLSGVLYFSLGDKLDTAKAMAYKAGDAFMFPAGMSMYAFTKDKPTVIQIHGTGPWGVNYATPPDGAMTKK